MASISHCWLTDQRVYCMKCIVLYWNQKFTYHNTFATKTISQLTELRCCYILNFLGGVLVRGVVYMWRPERFCLDPVTLCGKLCGTLWHTVSHCVSHFVTLCHTVWQAASSTQRGGKAVITGVCRNLSAASLQRLCCCSCTLPLVATL